MEDQTNYPLLSERRVRMLDNMPRAYGFANKNDFMKYTRLGYARYMLKYYNSKVNLFDAHVRIILRRDYQCLPYDMYIMSAYRKILYNENIKMIYDYIIKNFKEYHDPKIHSIYETIEYMLDEIENGNIKLQ